MNTLIGLAAILAAAFLLFLLLCYICYLLAFRRHKPSKEEYDLPNGAIYEPFREAMIHWADETRKLPHEDVSITSFDGLTLRGKYYEYAPGAPIELMFHGYRGSSERDMSGGVQRCFSIGRSALVIDQRAGGASEGKTITFGILERRDCQSWAWFMAERFGPKQPLILTGISMGASTVMMASALDLPENVVGIVADCGFTTPRQIIQKVLRQLKLPAAVLYPFIYWGAKLFGRFDLEEASATEALKKCTVPVFFAHGEDDDFVPREMTIANYNACAAPKTLFLAPGAGHGLSFPVDKEGYKNALRESAKHYRSL